MAKIELIEGSDEGSEQSDVELEPSSADVPSPKKQKTSSSSSSKNANRDQQKVLLRERRARRLHSNVIEAARVAWGSESIKNAPADQRHGRVEAVLHEIKALIGQICLKHDVSRLVQSCIKYGSDAQRSLIADGLKGHMLELCMNQYGYHVVLKLLRYGSRPIQIGVIDELNGNLVRLSQHRVAFKIVDLAWRSTCNLKQKNALLLEIYGKEFSLFRDASKPAPSMSQLLATLDANKRDALLNEVRAFLDKCIGKGTLQLSLFHSVLCQYLEQIDDRSALIESLKEHSLQICATLDGVIATCLMLDYANPKQRKIMIKSWKGQIVRMATDSDGYMAIAKALTIVDDAVLLQKGVIAELIPEMVNVMQSPAGSKVLLQIVAPGKARFFTSMERKVLATVASMSKKSDDARRNDNLKVLIPAMIGALKQSFLLANNLLRDRCLAGLFENCLSCAMQMSEEVQAAARDYIAEFTSCLSQTDLTDLNENHLVAHPVAHRTLKSLCASVQSLMHPVFTDFCLNNISAILNSRAVWIMVPLVESIPDIRTAVKKALKGMDCSEPGLTKLKQLCK